MMKTFLFILFFSLSVVVASGIEANVPRQPAPAKPSKRFLDERAPARPSKRLVARHPAPTKAAPQKRSIDEQHVVEMESQRGFCLDGLMACPILSTPGQFPRTIAEWEAVGFECVDFAADLSSCGGCSSLDPVVYVLVTHFNILLAN